MGREFSLERTVSTADLDAFIAITGDESPLHVDHRFAVDHGFEGRVVHGAFQAGMVSKLVGTQFPGASCQLHSMDLQFPALAYVGDALRATK